MPVQNHCYEICEASAADRPEIYRMRHAIYAAELRQHAPQSDERLSDSLDTVNTYIVLRKHGRLIGFISITPPNPLGYSVDKYVERSMLPMRFDNGLYELRLLTVDPEERGTLPAVLLMYAGIRWISSCGATQIVVLGRSGATDGLYRRVGFRPVSPPVTSGEVSYVAMHAEMEQVRANIRRIDGLEQRIRRHCRWELPVPFDDAVSCYHGGASIVAAGDDYSDIDRSESIITADVLDAWYPPAEPVIKALRDHLPYLLRTSPPADAAGLLRRIGEYRRVHPAMLVPGAGSSDLIFRAFQRWLSPASRVLMPDPTYGEYAHVAGNVIGARVDRLRLERETGYRIDPEALLRRLKTGYDLVVLVNPNSPTGGFIPRDTLRWLLRRIPESTIVWVDETYVDYCGPDASLEPFVVGYENLVVCKSMSKVYALSGVRVGYLCAPPEMAQTLRSITPPWIVSGPAQLAGIRALESAEYYERRLAETRTLRTGLAEALNRIDGIDDAREGAANFILCHLDDQCGDVASFINTCRVHGLYLRDLRSMTADETPAAFRIAVKDADTNRRMVEIIRQVLDVTSRGNRESITAAVPILSEI